MCGYVWTHDLFVMELVLYFLLLNEHGANRYPQNANFVLQLVAVFQVSCFALTETVALLAFGEFKKIAYYQVGTIPSFDWLGGW